MESKNPQLEAMIQRGRHSGSDGSVIHMHRSLRRLKVTPSVILSIFLLPIFFIALIWANIEGIISLWAGIFDFWISKLVIGSTVEYVAMDLPGKIAQFPYPLLPVTAPTKLAIWANLVISIILFMLSSFMPKNYLPLCYLLRTILVIQILASIYFAFHPGEVLYDLKSYISDMMMVGMYMLLIISPFLALIYYIFDFSLLSKLAATALLIGYFIIFLPFQYMMHAIVISQGSILFMPAMYMIFGVMLNTLIFISYFSWIMSWKRANKSFAYGSYQN